MMLRRRLSCVCPSFFFFLFDFEVAAAVDKLSRTCDRLLDFDLSELVVGFCVDTCVDPP